MRPTPHLAAGGWWKAVVFNSTVQLLLKPFFKGAKTAAHRHHLTQADEGDEAAMYSQVISLLAK